MKERSVASGRIGDFFSDFLQGRWRAAFLELRRKNRMSVLQENVERAVAEYNYLAVPVEALVGAGYISLDVALKSGWRVRWQSDYETGGADESGSYVMESN